jgi:hypothetical protein
VLQLTAQRDGPGSVKTVPVLEHLVTVSKAQNNLSDAIGYQSTLLDFAKAASIPEPGSVINAQIALSNLYLQQDDYHSAAAVLHDSYKLSAANPSLAPEKRRVVIAAYGKVLRQLHREKEADAVEKAGDDEAASAKSTDSAQKKGVAPTPGDGGKSTDTPQADNLIKNGAVPITTHQPPSEQR